MENAAPVLKKIHLKKYTHQDKAKFNEFQDITLLKYSSLKCK